MLLPQVAVTLSDSSSLWLRADSHKPCRSPATTLPLPCHSPTVLNEDRSPTCRLWTADANSHIPCRSHVGPLPWTCRGHERSLSERHIRGMACVNQTRPHCVNQMEKTQSKHLAERHGRGTAWYVWIRLKFFTADTMSIYELLNCWVASVVGLWGAHICLILSLPRDFRHILTHSCDTICQGTLSSYLWNLFGVFANTFQSALNIQIFGSTRLSISWIWKAKWP
jgi:hypothetical protein